jgi:hypothetical protein
MKIGLTDLPKKYKQHPMLKGVPDDLKDMKKYKEVEKKLVSIMLTSHKHKLASAFAKCESCAGKMQERRDYITKLGFKDYAQFMLYRRVMNIINNNGVQL